MKMSQLKTRVMRMTVYLELILAMFITAGIIIGMVDLARYLILIYQTNPIDTYDVLQKFLGHILLLVVGVEMVAMLVMHTPGSVIEVLLYAIARSMLVGNKGTFDFILGILSIAGIFAIRKFLFTDHISQNEGANVFSAAAAVSEVNCIAGVNLPEGIADTLGGLVSHISKEACRQVYEGIIFHVSDAEIRVVRFRDGVIEKVAVSENTDK
ncbi:MAG TPA: transporter associated domain-containing protein [Clostridia bacterium]|nr:transporter associated domain-containing protein [Clostridia bacterium]